MWVSYNAPPPTHTCIKSTIFLHTHPLLCILFLSVYIFCVFFTFSLVRCCALTWSPSRVQTSSPAKNRWVTLRTVFLFRSARRWSQRRSWLRLCVITWFPATAPWLHLSPERAGPINDASTVNIREHPFGYETKVYALSQLPFGNPVKVKKWGTHH